MNDTNVIPLAQPDQFNDALTEVLRDGASRLLTAAVEAEVEAHLAAYSDLKLPEAASHSVVYEVGAVVGWSALFRASRPQPRATYAATQFRFVFATTQTS